MIGLTQVMCVTPETTVVVSFSGATLSTNGKWVLLRGENLGINTKNAVFTTSELGFKHE